MNQGIVQSSLLQQMGVAGSPNWPWSINNNTQPPPHHQHHSFLAAPPHNHIAPQPWTCSHDLPESWSQLFTGLAGEDVKAAGMNYVQATDLDNWEQQLLHPTSNSSGSNRKQQNPATYDPANLEFLQAAKSTDFSSPKMASASPSKTCIATSSMPSDIFGFSNKPSQISVKCNSTATGGVAKKARINPTSSAQTSIKVRKEKLGDRITALHQLVSPFGKTDTASVLLEAIGYIRFLQRQIEALSVPHLGSGSGNMIRRQQPLLNENSIKRKATSGQEYRDEDEPKKDLKSRGLCLVPISSCTVEVGGDSIGADYWTQSFGANFK